MQGLSFSFTLVMPDSFQSQKFRYFFHILDLNDNGYVQLDDFSEMAEKVREIMKYEDGSKDHKRITDKATKFFHSLIADINPADKQQISEDEWVGFLESEVINDEDALDHLKERVFNFMFDFFDQNRDGFISRREYEDFYHIFGINDQFLDKAFQMLDNSNTYRLSRYDLMSAVEDFFASEDEDVPGNWIFGNWESSLHSSPA